MTREADRVGVWTDDYSNLLSVFEPYIRFRERVGKFFGRSTGIKTRRGD